MRCCAASAGAFSARTNYGTSSFNKQKNTTSVSKFVRQAIIEKMIREEPEKGEYFESLLILEKL